MSKTNRGEVWLADLGLAGKVRPVLVLSVPFGDSDYALVTVVPHTTSPRRSQYEVALPVAWLQSGAFNIQGTLAVPESKLLRRLGGLNPAQIQNIEAALKRWLGLTSG